MDDAVVDFLEKANVQLFRDEFEELGLAQMCDLYELEPADLDAIGMKPLQRRRFDRMLQDWKTSEGEVNSAVSPTLSSHVPRPGRSIIDMADESGQEFGRTPPGFIVSSLSGLVFSQKLNSLAWKTIGNAPDTHQEAELLGSSVKEAQDLLAWARGQWAIDCANYELEHATLIRNEKLLEVFNTRVLGFNEQRSNHAKVFCADLADNAKPDDLEEKRRFLKHFLRGGFRDTGLRLVQLMTAFHGCGMDAADSIAHRGAKDLAKTDGGFFARGSYLTRQASYAASYASGDLAEGPNPTNEHGQWVVMLCIIVTGNTYPITRRTDYDDPDNYEEESICRFHHQWPMKLGVRSDKAILSGFDCHYIPVSSMDPVGFECAPGLEFADAEEFVMKEESQVLPLMKLFYRTKAAAQETPLLAAELQAWKAANDVYAFPGPEHTAVAKLQTCEAIRRELATLQAILSRASTLEVSLPSIEAEREIASRMAKELKVLQKVQSLAKAGEAADIDEALACASDLDFPVAFTSPLLERRACLSDPAAVKESHRRPRISMSPRPQMTLSCEVEDAWRQALRSRGSTASAALARPVSPVSSAAPAAENFMSSPLADVFRAYCGGTKSDLDGRAFVKLCKDCNLLDKAFTVTVADILFSKTVTKGQRRMSLLEFEHALALMAEKKRVDVEVIREAVALNSAGPVLRGTVAEVVRFHDDGAQHQPRRPRSVFSARPSRSAE